MTTQLQLIQQNFNRAANTYLTHAELQSRSARKLILAAQQHLDQGAQIILDLGSGPGTFRQQHLTPTKQVISLDLSLNMLKLATNSNRVNADAAYLPFASQSIDIIISNLMLQWPLNKSQVFNEISRVLKPTGKLIFTTLIQPSLNELKQSWAQIDNQAHTLEFLTSNDYHEFANRAGLGLIKQETWQEKLFFDDLLSLFKHFSQTGTSLPKATTKGLGGKQQFQQLSKLYPREANRLPLSYHYLIQRYSKE